MGAGRYDAAAMRPPRIDVHTHILPPPEAWPDLSAKFGYAGWIALEALARKGAGGCGCAKMVRIEQQADGRALRGADGRVPDSGKTFFREIEANCWDPAVRMAEMDGWGEREMVQVLSTVPVMFGYWARPADTTELSRWLNDHLAGVCREHPRRFVGLGTIPMNDPKMAVRELERCCKDLKFAGVQIGSNVNGRNLGESEFAEVFAAAEALGACVFVHPWEMLCGPGMNMGVGGVPRPPVMSPRLGKHWAAWLVVMPAETCLALCSVIFSGLLERLPRLRIGFAHGGGSFAGTLGRIDHGFHARPDLCQTETRLSPRSHAAARPAKFFVDSLVHDAAALGLLMETVGADRIMLGSDYPFPLGEECPGTLIRTVPGVSDEDRERMLSLTAIEFLGSAAAHLARGADE